MNRRLLLIIVLAVAALLAGRALRHAPHLPLTVNSWTASRTAGNFIESGINQDQHIALILAPEAQLRLSRDNASLPEGETIPLHATFDDNSSFAFTGADAAGAIAANFAPGELPDFIPHMERATSLVISFDDQQAAPLAFQLSGAAPTLAALTRSMRHDGIFAFGSTANLPGFIAGTIGLSIGWLITIVALLYFLPAVIAYTRGSTHRGIILLLNLLLGWTVIGWWILLVIALLTARVSPARRPGQYPTRGG